MSYQVLARKWRPHQFKDVVGQSHVLTALANALDHNRLHHAYLFSGTRGVGKTTIARIFAKGLNCEQGVTSTPCGVCSTCQEIDQGRFVDLLEIDAASRTKVEDTRDLLDNVQYKPARGRYKVYLIDEVHMLSRHSFNALLKTLEEPPEYVKFLLATTDPQKLPVTILSRCLQFHLKHLDTTQIKHQLEHVLTEETVASEPRALSLIARAAEGSMRDALSLTDQAIALGNGAVNEAQVTEMLGTLSTDQALLLLETLSSGDANLVMQCLTQLAEVGVEWDGLLKEIASQLHRVAMAQALPESVDTSSPDAERVTMLSHALTPQDTQLFYQIVLQGRQDLPYAPDGRAGLEMVLLRMLAFRPVTSTHFEPEAISVPSTDPGLRVAVSLSQAAPSTQVAPVQDRIASLKAQVASSRAQSPIQPQTAPAPAQPAMPVMPESAPSHQAPNAYTPESAPAGNVEPQAPIRPHTADVDPQLSSHMAAMEQDAQREYDDDDNAPSPMQQAPSHAYAPQGQQSSAPSERPSSAGDLLAARNMLRSRARQQEGQPPKKGSPASAGRESSSVLDRIAAKHKPADPASFQQVTTSGATPVKSDDAYRWQPTKIDATTPAIVVTPEKIKKALLHDRTPEMRKKLEQESIDQDEWCRIANGLDVPRLVKQMALNASMKKEGNDVLLTLRSEQAHLNKDKAQTLLADGLSQLIGSPINLTIELGEQGVTPLEWRDKLYTEKLTQAGQSLSDDPNVRFICQRFSAELDEESIRPI
ncbi:DNA polymerase III subunit gamma/tau [Enterovibrio norvegicus]|uniref:DNA polymerase III subunit gamma/tau n=1 Tax=Enterovibrio norvegicus TaxID=188144 RepID=UPI000C856AF8|nr:DNA polymerase III subunit gamma/tau [Enterovibrio norvegicus]MCC4797921.1 DNA polymerase III subunit gamma/tau [Enterovibrio norvegicus]PMH72530.1 DNA polymerase III subunit gamma/tau [Enterovibrio norvegicus]PMI33060.1 DNA polymerase III subunit gamma/tau [Enterovibrio norvegicus]PMI34830.1 DNA polymerase III subunit gamma/tau [Enterovibrio norvegicus]PMN45037.1 DNA polymerase III subunit gamma/tau [Enterovibrio norvegicus]